MIGGEGGVLRENREASNSSSTSNSSNSRTTSLIILYLVSENFMLNPKSCVVVGYELDDSSGVLVCLS